MNKRNIIINSTLLFVIAFLWQTTLHELAHFITATLLHAKDVKLYHNYANYDSTSLSDKSLLIIAAAGPMFSLFIGFLFNLFCAAYKKRNSLFLFSLYMSSFGYICFGGYLLIAPFFENGDTGFVFKQLGFPIWSIYGIAALGFGFILFIGKFIGKYFAEMANTEIMSDQKQLKTFADNIIKFPLYIGVVLVTLLNLPVVSFLSLMYPLFNPMNLFWIYGYAIDKPYPTTHANMEFDKLQKLQPVLFVVFIITIAINRLLVYGFHF